jgi:hypothetical protein
VLTLTLTAPQKQNSIINLVKQFYIQSAPLLYKNEEVLKEFEWIVTELEPLSVKAITPNVAGFEWKQMHDPQLDVKMNQALVKLQIELQKEGFFMPSSKDPRFSWGHGD